MALTLRRLEGFDAVDTATRALAMDSVVNGTSITVASPGASGSGNYLRVNASGCRARWSLGTVVALGDRVIHGFAFMFEDNSYIFWGVLQGDNTDHVHFQITAGHLIQATRSAGGTVLATGATVIAEDVWYYLEIEVVTHDTLGEVHLFLNGVEEFSITGQDTRNGGTGLIEQVQFLAATGQASRIDDMYFGTAPAADTPKANFYSAVAGIPRIATLVPNGPGNWEMFAPSSGTDVFAMVDDAAPDDNTTYNAGHVVGEKDTMAASNLPSSGDIYAVQMDIYAVKQDAGNRSLREVYRIGSTDYVGNEVPLSPTTYAYQRAIRTVSPDTAVAWIESEVNGMEIGYEIAV